MNWTGSRELRVQLQRYWDRGEFLRGVATGHSLFPLRLTLKAPTSRQIGDQFDAVRAWIAELRALPHYRIEMRELRHRVLGTNEVPKAIWIDSLDDALEVLGKRRQAGRFSDLVECTRRRQPGLLDWVGGKPLKALGLADDWDRLLDVVHWVRQHPYSGVYLRQVDIPGVHSKFIEAHRGVLTQWLDRLLPPAAIDTTAVGTSGFARRFGFRDKPHRIRLRALDPPGALLPAAWDADLVMDAESFARLAPAVSRIFITENEINFLTFPRVPESLVIFGAGYGFDILAGTAWLVRCKLYYWGDIDTHGFAMLDQLRGHLPQVRSLLMDRTTLLAFEDQWGVEDKQTLKDLSRLNSEEYALYNDLRDNRLGPNLRLEQERIGFSWVEAALATLACGAKKCAAVPPPCTQR